MPLMVAFSTLLSLQALIAFANQPELIPNITAQIFDQKHVASLGHLFKFSEEGNIIDGPRRGKNEPVDYSVLLNNEAIKIVFIQSLSQCWSGRRNCASPLIRWEDRRLPITIFIERTSLGNYELLTIEEIVAAGIEKIGFSISPEPDIEKASLIIISGSIPYLKFKAEELGAEFAVEYYERLKEERGDLGWLGLFNGPGDVGVSCFVSTRDRATKGQVYLFFHPEDLETCLPQQLLVAIGLNETAGYFPTITGAERKYHTPTLVDIAFMKALYDADFPINGDMDEVGKFFSEYLLEHPVQSLDYPRD